VVVGFPAWADDSPGPPWDNRTTGALYDYVVAPVVLCRQRRPAGGGEGFKATRARSLWLRSDEGTQQTTMRALS